MDHHWTDPELLEAIIRENKIEKSRILYIHSEYDIERDETRIEIAEANEDIRKWRAEK